MTNLLHRDAIPVRNAGHDIGTTLVRLLVILFALGWLAAGFFVWLAFMGLALLLATLRVPLVLVRRLFGRQP